MKNIILFTIFLLSSTIVFAQRITVDKELKEVKIDTKVEKLKEDKKAPKVENFKSQKEYLDAKKHWIDRNRKTYLEITED